MRGSGTAAGFKQERGQGGRWVFAFVCPLWLGVGAGLGATKSEEV